MMSSHQTSDPSTPKVSSAQKKFQRCVCRFCGCHGAQCLVPEGQHGYRTCFWVDEEETVCAAPMCIVKLAQELNAGAAIASNTHPQFMLKAILSSRGFATRVARSLGVNRSSVCKVLKGAMKSARISAALAAEIERINEEVLSGNGVRVQETLPRETKAKSSATASPDNAVCGANEEVLKPASDRRAVSPSKRRRANSFAARPKPLTPYLTVNAVAEALGVSMVSVLRLLWEGKIKGYQLNNRGWWRIDADSVNSYMNKLEAAR